MIQENTARSTPGPRPKEKKEFVCCATPFAGFDLSPQPLRLPAKALDLTFSWETVGQLRAHRTTLGSVREKDKTEPIGFREASARTWDPFSSSLHREREAGEELVVTKASDRQNTSKTKG